MTPVQLVPGVGLTTTESTCYVVPASDQRVKLVRLTSVWFLNTSASACAVSLFIVPPGGSTADQYARFKGLTVPSSTSGGPPLFFRMDDVMLPGSKLVALATASGAVMFSASGESYP